MAVKAEQLCSGPGAITWIHASERACIVTSRALDVSRDKGFGVMFLRQERGQVLVQQTGHPVAPKLRASSHAFPSIQKFDHTGAVVRDSTHAAACGLALVL